MVFPQDPEWQREYQRHHGDDATKNVRFRSWNTEELLVRCCMKYMPWLRRIHILLARESQVREWMHRLKGEDGRLRIVFHRDIMPSEYLPCYSSPCFEMFLHRIPGLAEHFIYANDDMFPLSPLSPDDFFRPVSNDGTSAALRMWNRVMHCIGIYEPDYQPCQHVHEKKYPANPNIFQKKCMYQQTMIGSSFGWERKDVLLRTGHSFAPILKSTCEEVWRRHGEDITAHLSPLKRTDHSCNHYIYLLHQYFTGAYKDHTPREQYIGPATPSADIAGIIRNPTCGIVCLNDNEQIMNWESRAETVRKEIESKLKMGTGMKNTGNSIALCAIGRRENRYAREFVEHYIGLGFDHIYICDNNRGGEERFEDVLQEYIDSGVVSIHDYRDRDTVQMQAYTEIYALYGGMHGWMAFFDFDEYLVLESGTVKKWLDKNRDADAVLVNWMCMTDGGMIHDDGRPLLERFTEAMPYDTPVQYDFPDNDHVKSIVRGGLAKVVFRRNPHVPDTAQCCHTADGVPCEALPFQPYSYKTAYLKHFVTKTVEEWMKNKWQKGAGAIRYDRFLEKYRGRFFKYNEWTREKQQYMDVFENCMRQKITVCIVNYNTTQLTQCAIRSLQKHSPGAGIIVFDNSDREPLPPMDGVEILDNTKGQLINFGKWLQAFPDKQPTKNQWASAKHCYTVQWLINKRRNPFLLMDSDVLIKQDISSRWDLSQAFVGERKPHNTVYRITVDRVLPFLCFINVPMLKGSDTRYFDPANMYALTSHRPGIAYDTGCWFLEDVRKHRLPYRTLGIDPYVTHFGHGSWKDKDAATWINENRELWE